MEFKDVAPILAVVLPAIAALFLYRQTERRRDSEIASAAKSGPISIAGPLGEQGAVGSLAVVLMEIASTFARYLSLLEGERDDEERGDSARKRQLDRLLDEMIAVRRCLEEIARQPDVTRIRHARPLPPTNRGRDP